MSTTTHTSLRPDGREEIAIVGGGLEGSLTALMLARVKKPDGTPRYHITLLEENGVLFNEASLLAARLHLGGEYPLDLKTALDCLVGAVIWKLVMPPYIYTDREKMKFAISHKTEAEGQKAIGKKKELKTLTMEKFAEHYEKIRIAYEHLFNTVHVAKTAEAQRQGVEWGKYETGDLLFGPPDEGKFFHPLKASDILAYDYAPGDFSSKIVDGFQTQELGLNVPLYLSALENALHEEEKSGNITIELASKVKKIVPPEPGRPGSVFHVETDKGASIAANQVVQAAYANNKKLLVESGHVGKPVKALNRAMLVLDLGEKKSARMTTGKLQPIFRLLGENEGCMLAPYNDRFVLVYVTSAAYVGGEKLLTDADPAIPDEWARSHHVPKIGWEEGYLKYIKLRFPILKDATIVPGGLVRRVTLNFDDALEQRRHEPTQEVAPGHIVMNATKATLGPRCAMEATQMVLARSEGRKADIGTEHMLDIALAGTHSLNDVVVDKLKAVTFAHQHPPLPAYLIDFDDQNWVSVGDRIVHVDSPLHWQHLAAARQQTPTVNWSTRTAGGTPPAGGRTP